MYVQCHVHCIHVHVHVLYTMHITPIPVYRTSELQERLSAAQERLRQAESDLEELQGEKSAKYRELKKREETMKGTYCTCVQYDMCTVQLCVQYNYVSMYMYKCIVLCIVHVDTILPSSVSFFARVFGHL